MGKCRFLLSPAALGCAAAGGPTLFLISAAIVMNAWQRDNSQINQRVLNTSNISCIMVYLIGTVTGNAKAQQPKSSVIKYTFQ